MNNAGNIKTSSIAKRMVLYIALCSIVITVLITSFQVWRDYKVITVEIGRELKQIDELYIKSITEGLWLTDTRRLKTLIEGMATLRDVNFVAIYENKILLVSTGEKLKKQLITQTYPLQYRFRGRDLLLGTLEVAIDIKGAEQRVFDRGLELLVNNAIETLVIVSFLYLILHNLLFRHLSTIVSHLTSMKPDSINPPLKLARKKINNSGKDELDLVVGAINDISKRVMLAFSEILSAEKAKQLSEEKFRDYALSSSDWFWEMDKDLKIVFLSEKYEIVTGYKSEDFVRKSRQEFAAEETDTEKWKSHIHILNQHLPFRDFNYAIFKANGDKIVVRVNGTPVFDGDGSFAGYRGTSTDITEQKHIEILRDDALIQAEKANRAKSEFLATMSHEFRTPLNAILGFSDMLRAEYFGPIGSDTYKDYANDIHTSGEHMLTLVNDVLDISAIEAGKRQIEYEYIDVADLIFDSVRKIQKIADDGDITIKILIAPDVPELFADKRSVMQIMLNVLSNAVKYTPENGTIEISAEFDEKNLQLSVKDNGRGIPSDKIKHITEPFFQVVNGAHAAHPGTGLGLAIVKSLTDVHNGQLQIISDLGKGTTVIVTLPIHPGQK